MTPAERLQAAVEDLVLTDSERSTITWLIRREEDETITDVASIIEKARAQQ